MTAILSKITETITLEKNTLENLLTVIDESFQQAVQLIYQNSQHKLIISGMGKSGYVAGKMAATFSSTGTPAFFLHPSEALHGDLGIVNQNDVLILISKSGESDEMIGMLPSLKKIECHIIAITSNQESTLAQNAEIVLYTPVEKEACILNLAPTCSIIAALAVGDALAVATMNLKNISQENFALYHPAGRIGKRLLYLVDDLMSKSESLIVTEDTSFEIILTNLAKAGMNALSVVNKQQHFCGLITSYDIRQPLLQKIDLYSLKAKDIMFRNPVTIDSGTYAITAYELMKNHSKPLNVLPILKNSIPIGMLSLQDMIRAGL